MGKIVINSVAELDTLRQIAFYTFIIKRCWGQKPPTLTAILTVEKIRLVTI